jgi:uncharacterized metal-binding protein YceD (DUF177 family)
MKLKVTEIHKPMTLTITGQEPWLVRIYQPFLDSRKSATEHPRLTGELRITAIPSEPETIVKIEGSLSFAPYLDCSRCSQKIAWPINAGIDVYFEPPVEEEPTTRQHLEINLRSDDLDRYFYLNNEIDLEGLINDTIQSYVPSQAVRKDPESDQCLVCGEDLSGDVVYADKASVRSPFADLLKRN